MRLLIEVLVTFVVDALLGIVLTCDLRARRRSKHNYTTMYTDKINSDRIKLNRAMILLIIVLAYLLFHATGCVGRGGLVQQAPDGHYVPSEAVTNFQQTAHTVGQALAPATGGISAIAGEAAGGLAFLIAMAVAYFKNKAKARALDTINTVLLTHAAGPEILRSIDARAKDDGTAKTIEQHIG